MLLDITCDSDGAIDHYIDGDGIATTMPMPEYDPENPTMLGFFIFGQVPDGWSFLGYGIICLMAIFMFVYNNRKRKNTQKQALLESKEPSDVIKM